MLRRYVLLLALVPLAGPSVTQGETGLLAPAPPTITSAPPAFTTATEATFGFTHEDPLVTFECSLDGAPFSGCTSPQEYTALAESPHSFQVRAVDLLGPGDPATHAWTVDRTPPVVVLTSPAAGSSTNDSTPTFSGTAGTAPGDASTVTVVIRLGTATSGKPHTSFSAPVDPATGVWAGAPTTLADGTYTARASQSDAAGNGQETDPRTFAVDTSPPVVTLSSPAPGTVTNNPAPTFSGTASRAPGDAATVTVAIRLGTATTGTPHAAFTAPVNPATGAWAGSPAALADGTYTATAEQLDAAGNRDESDPRTFTIDTLAPSVTLSSPPPGSSTNDPTPTLSGTAGTAAGDQPQVTVRLWSGTGTTGPPHAAFTAPVNAATGVWAGSPAALADGTYTAIAEQSDAAGNRDESGPSPFTIDTLAPAVTLSSPQDGSATNDTTPTLSGTAGTAAGDEPRVTVRLWSGPATTGSPDLTMTASVNLGLWTTEVPTPLAGGLYSGRAQQVDAAGNTRASATSTFRVDLSVPAVAVAVPAPGAVTNQSRPTFSGTADGGTVTVKIFDGPLTTGSPAQTLVAPVAGGSWSASPGGPLTDGLHAVLAETTNAVGTTGASAAVLFTVDTAAPTFTTLSGDQILEQSSAAGALLSYSVTATDALDPGPRASCSPPPGAVVPLGRTRVTCTATDWAGNAAAAGFWATVQNTVPPAEVLGFSAAAGMGRVRLAWQRPADFDYRKVVLQRKPKNRSDWTTILETGDATQYVDRRVRNDREYTYRIVSLDAVGHASAPVMETARPSAFYAPAWNAVVTSPPLLRWAKVGGARYYNVQVWRNGRKVLSRWPVRPRYKMTRSWVALGRRVRLTSGTYYAFAWPGRGRKAAADYGRIVGWTRFVVP